MSFPESHNCFTDSVSFMVKTHHYSCHSQNFVCSDFNFLLSISFQKWQNDSYHPCFQSHVISLRLLFQVCHSQTWVTVISVIPNFIYGSDSYLVGFKKALVFFHSFPKHIYRPQTKFAKVMFLHAGVILSTGGGGVGGIPACTTGHMTKHYISSCTGDQSQLMTGQHTGNVKCMMG